MTPLKSSYEYQARVRPAMLTALPLGATLLVVLGLSRSVAAGILSALAGAGVSYFAAHLVRDRGRRLEPRLWASWGGTPTTQVLLDGPDESDQVRSRRWDLMRKLYFSAVEPEDGPPSIGDAEAYVLQLRELTRDGDQFPLVASELAGYGFRRNLLGMRRVGISLCAAATVIAVAAAAIPESHHPGHRLLFMAMAVLDAVAALLWIRMVSSEWVKVQAFDYARALLGAAEKINASSQVNGPGQSTR